ncbi:MAG: FCD domain-containing protein [Burkholderiaceae bacterium]
MALNQNDDPSRTGGAETLTEQAYRSLRADIIRGERKPGERLRIEKLKAIYGIGPTPIREALQKLSIERLVLAQENRGFSVAPLDLADFADLNFARIEIEKVALRRSIELGDSAWEARVVAASYLMAKADAQLEQGHGATDAWERMNAEFHLAMVGACQSRWLLITRQNLQDMCERYRRSSMHSGRFTGGEHHEIAQAVLARDADRACALTEAHFMATFDTLSDAPAQPAAAATTSSSHPRAEAHQP